MGDVLRVVLAEDDALLRQGVVRLLDGTEGVELVADCEDLPSLQRLVAEHRPDVVITDIRMPPTGTDEGIQAADWLHEEYPETGVVVLSQYVEPEYAVRLLRPGSGRRAYLLKERVSDIEELVHAVREVAAGGSVVDPEVVDSLVASRRASPLDDLTPREREVLAEMATGKTNSAIAQSLVLSERAIEKHSNNIFAKLGLSEERDVNRRVKAVLIYLAEGPPPSEGR